MARRRPRHVGQSLRAASPRRVRSAEPPADAPHPDQGRSAVLTAPIYGSVPRLRELAGPAQKAEALLFRPELDVHDTRPSPYSKFRITVLCAIGEHFSRTHLPARRGAGNTICN